jgi:hypothetical protein
VLLPGADQGHELAALDVDVDAAQGVDRIAIGPVNLFKAAGFDDSHGSLPRT